MERQFIKMTNGYLMMWQYHLYIGWLTGSIWRQASCVLTYVLQKPKF